MKRLFALRAVVMVEVVAGDEDDVQKESIARVHVLVITCMIPTAVSRSHITHELRSFFPAQVQNATTCSRQAADNQCLLKRS